MRITRGKGGFSALHPRFIAVGASLFMAGFATDLMYVNTSIWQWANASAWLISSGLIVALIATLALGVDLLIGTVGRMDWGSFAITAVAALLSLVNAFVHSRDAWTSVVPEGITLSAIVAVLLLVEGARGWRVATPKLAVEEV